MWRKLNYGQAIFALSKTLSLCPKVMFEATSQGNSQ